MAQAPHVTIVDSTGNPFSSTAPLPTSGGQALGTDTTNSATAAANTATSATLAAVAGKTTFITGFAVTVATGTAGPTGLITITGTVGGTLNYQLGGNATGAAIHVDFSRAVPASAVNTAIVVNVPALGATTGAVAVTARGYQL